MKKDLNAASARLTAKARELVLEEREAAGQTWFCPDKGPFKAAKVAFYLLGGVLVVLLLANLMGELLIRGDLTPGGDSYARLISDLRMTALCLILTAAGIILCRVRQYAVSGGLALLEAVLFLVNQNWEIGKFLTEGGWKRPALYILPTVLFGLCALYLLICDVSERARIRRQRDDLLRRIEAAHPHSGERITTAEEWDAYVEEFLAGPVHAKPKRSLRQKKKKEERD